MAKNTPTPANNPAEKHTDPTPRRGYSFAELRYQRALTALQMEFCKSRMRHEIDNLKKARFLPFGANDARSSWVGKILSGLHYTDYVLLGFSTFSTLRKVFSFFHGRKPRTK